MKKFPIAPQTYFHIKNTEEARNAFLENPKILPDFEYRRHDIDTLRSRIDDLHKDDEKVRLSLELVAASLMLRKAPTPGNIARYRKLNKTLYGEPDADYAYAILARTLRKATGKREDIVDYITERIPNIPVEARIYKPSADTFQLLRSHIQQYVHFAEFDHDMPLATMLARALEVTGLAGAGWTVEIKDDSRHAVTEQRLKKIVIGRTYVPRSDISKMQIMLHEVYGHAMRGHQDDLVESEGFAGLLEQLVPDYYASRRSYRFLAAALGWGTLGSPMNFREIYEILWRVMAGGEYYSEEDAKVHAFSECIRVYRGGDPKVPGAIFLKDSLYFKANIDIWKEFERRPPTYREFSDIIEGKRKVLS